MNLKRIESYARGARRDFIGAVAAAAAVCGITEKGTEPFMVRGDVALINGRPFPATIVQPRRQLEERIQRSGYSRVMEACAYTWFNRFVAIRYMELHNFLSHGLRVLSHPDNRDLPEILVRAHEVRLEGLDRQKVIDLKLDGTRDEELYRLLLLTQCAALHRSMPFLFDPIGSATGLLLPRNLLRGDSVAYRLAHVIDEGDWREIEIVGWLYQFYIAERRDEIIGKRVASEDIPAATQLFTPKWIVKYLVQNSLGAAWLETNPESSLAQDLSHYINPTPQSRAADEAQITVTRSTLNPEELTLMDPAVGSGHILVEAYDVLKAIYLERGYSKREIPSIILRNNLFGLDIDPRAVQLAGFTLTMRALSDDSGFLSRAVVPNIETIVDGDDFDLARLCAAVRIEDYGLTEHHLLALKDLFSNGATIGSLISVPEHLAAYLSAIARLCTFNSADAYVAFALQNLKALSALATLLNQRYDVIATNPPYMGNRGMNPLIKRHVKKRFPHARNDLFACFIERGLLLARPGGFVAMVTMHSWMFLPSFEPLRVALLKTQTLRSLAHLGPHAFASIPGERVQTTAFVFQRAVNEDYIPACLRLVEGGEVEKQLALTRGQSRYDRLRQKDYHQIPGSPIVYWLAENIRKLFDKGSLLGDLVEARVGLQTGNNNKFLRRWWEVDIRKCGFDIRNRNEARQSGRKWFPYNKGGSFRKWYGNVEHVVNWERDGNEIRTYGSGPGRRARSSVSNTDYFFQVALTWSDIASDPLSFRLNDGGLIHDVAGHSAFGFSGCDRYVLSAYCNSPIVAAIAKATNPTLHFQVGNFVRIPYLVLGDTGNRNHARTRRNVLRLLHLARADWDTFETSWDFQSHPLLCQSQSGHTSIRACYEEWNRNNREAVAETKRLEEESNRFFIDTYGLAEELSPVVPLDEITLTVNPAYRYRKKTPESEWESRFRRDTVAELISFGIGCMMGRYSLDTSGIVYAKSEGQGFDSSRYLSFPADDDGIIPITADAWFRDDAAERFSEFVESAWEPAELEQNLSFMAKALSPKKTESARETIRRYLATGFYKDHLAAYKKRPIYWLFCSGRRRAFQCLVYLHRYHEGTLARIRTEYAIPLQGMITSRLNRLKADLDLATGGMHRRRLMKERERLSQLQVELHVFDDKLRRYADERIQLDLNDGVKVNYGKFGDLLTRVQAVTGKPPKSWE